MPPRRSTRAASAQPAPKPPPKAPASRTKPRSQVNGVNGTSNKRSPSPDRPASPPAKRVRGDAKKSENEPPAGKRDNAITRKPTSAATRKAPEVSRKKKLSPVRDVEPAPEAKLEPVQLKPYFNQLPTPPQTHRPGLLPFIWGTGNFGQFGLGPDSNMLDEIPKPKRHIWIEKKMQEGIFGEVGAAIEFVAAGGLHTVFIDEKGTVGCLFFNILSPYFDRISGMDLWHKRQRCARSRYRRCI